MESEGLCSQAVMGSTSSGSSVETWCAAGRGQINESKDSTCDPGRVDSRWREDMGECAIPNDICAGEISPQMACIWKESIRGRCAAQM